jgi:hypothetical protein
MPSAIPAAKAAILTILEARPAMAGVTLAWAAPTKDEDYTETMVFLGDVERASDWAELGTGRRKEDFSVGLTVFVEMWGDDPQSTEERAYELLDEVEDALRDDIRASPGHAANGGRVHVERGPSRRVQWPVRLRSGARGLT